MAMTNYDVIYIDDESSMTDIFSHYAAFKYQHWRIRAFTNSQEAFDKIRSNEISSVVWIVDIMMPQKNGTEVAAAIQSECQAGTVVLGYTALDPYTLEQRPEFQAGLRNFSRIINKQEDFSSLLELVDMWVKK
jgi:DNA-binding NtrC family response regulator